MADRTFTTGQGEGRPVPEATDRLRHFCSAVLQLLDGPAGSPAIAAELAQAVGAGTRAVADGLRADLRSCEAAVEQLATLAQSRYLQPPGEVAGLCAELEDARTRGLRLLEALEALHGNGPTPAPALPLPVGHPAPVGSSSALPLHAGEREKPPAPEGKRPGQGAPIGKPPGDDTYQPPPAWAEDQYPIPAAPEPAIGNGPATPLDRSVRAPHYPTEPSPAVTAGQASPAHPAPIDTPAGRARAVDDRMEVSCPRCGHAGVIGWARLNKVIKCPACGKHFSVRPDGATTEVVCTTGGRWVDARARQPARRERTGGRLLVALTIVAVLVPGASALAWRAARGPARASEVEVELPRELEPRAELFAKAWLRNDLALMRRLTTPTHDRILYSWYTRHRPPTTPDGPPTDVRVELKTALAAHGMTTVRGRITGAGLPTEHGPIELALQWEQREGVWYCVPPGK